MSTQHVKDLGNVLMAEGPMAALKYDFQQTKERGHAVDAVKGLLYGAGMAAAVGAMAFGTHALVYGYEATVAALDVVQSTAKGGFLGGLAMGYIGARNERSSTELKRDIEEIMKNIEWEAHDSAAELPFGWNLVSHAANMLDLEVDPDNARESRLKVALALDAAGKVEMAVDVMKGQMAPVLAYLPILALKERGTDPRTIYEGFADIDNAN